VYAIFRDRGKQYKARQGEELDLDLRAGAKDGEAVTFDEVLLTSSEDGAKISVGTPKVAGAKVTATVLKADFKGKKLDIVHFRAKKDSMNMRGHRQRYTRIKVEKIEAGA
jgi:large subunit ribosomal protein L21